MGKITTVPGVKHYVIMKLLEYHSFSTCPSNLRVNSECEYNILSKGNRFRIDVYVTYWHNSYGHKRNVLYEIQKEVNLKAFKEKVSALEHDGAICEIIPLDDCPDDIIEASNWVKERIIIPNFRRNRIEH